MSKEKHTPGPWKVAKRQRYTIDVVVPAVSKNTIGYTIAQVSTAGEGEANARLIAAAPDLLAALEAAIVPLIRLGDFIGNNDAGGASGLGPFDRCAIIRQARAAIAKATGEE